MILNAYSIFDSKAANYSPPFFMANHKLAIRSFADIVNDRQTNICRHPEDFSLVFLGSFDDSVGVIEAIDHQPLMTASAVKGPDGLDSDTVKMVRDMFTEFRREEEYRRPPPPSMKPDVGILRKQGFLSRLINGVQEVR